MGKVESVTRVIYTAGDGKEFLDYATATDYEQRRAVRELLEKARVCRGGEWDQQMILDFIIENDRALIEALDPFYGEE